MAARREVVAARRPIPLSSSRRPPRKTLHGIGAGGGAARRPAPQDRPSLVESSARTRGVGGAAVIVSLPVTVTRERGGHVDSGGGDARASQSPEPPTDNAHPTVPIYPDRLRRDAAARRVVSFAVTIPRRTAIRGGIADAARSSVTESQLSRENCNPADALKSPSWCLFARKPRRSRSSPSGTAVATDPFRRVAMARGFLTPCRPLWLTSARR